MTGTIFLICGLIAALASIILPEKKLRLAAFVSAGFISASALYLWYLIFADDFTFEYVATYSSTTLPTVYKISAFWAGQQGSFLLWLLIHALAGAFLASIQNSKASLRIYFTLQILLSVLVLAKSPFAENPVEVVEGIGLNPLLQDFWMAIHPPLVFIGYALLAVPFALSLGNILTSPMSRKWLESARKWTLVALSFLGAGIFIGGYWAYKVLGWGGYWAWDPVENSSLVPWILTAVLLHLINLAKVKPAVVSVASIAAVTTYASAIYGTFLTRSGILGDFSVHSFAESNIGVLICAVNAIILIGGLLIIFFKAKSLPQGKMYETFSEPAFIILLSALLAIFIAIIVWLGMSMPLLTLALDNPASVDQDFYVNSTSPIAAVLIALVIYTFCKFKAPLKISGKIAHVGFIIGFAATFISSQGVTVTQEFQVGAETEIAGHKIIYEGQVFEEENRQKFYVFRADDNEVSALTKLRGNGEDAAREPAISKTFSGDVYIAPHPIQISQVQELLLTKDLFAMDGEIGYTFTRAEVDYDAQTNPVRAEAEIIVTDGIVSETITPLINVTKDGGSSQSIEFLQRRKRLRLTGVSGDLTKIRIEILPTYEQLSQMPVEATISTKPFIWLLWLGAFLICAGSLVSIWKGGR